MIIDDFAWEWRHGTRVIKVRGVGYGGPGRVAGVAWGEDGSQRTVVAHVIEGGDGEFFHIYLPRQLVRDQRFPANDPDQATLDLKPAPAPGAMCSHELQRLGRLSPRTCQVCGLGPCRKS